MTRTSVLFVSALALAGCGTRGDRGPIVASGHVEATEVRLATKVAGRVEALLLDEGDVVKAGQELARIDTTDLRLQREQAAADREQASAEARLRAAGYRSEDKAELREQAAALAAELNGAQTDLDRMQGLLDKGSGTAKARDDARTRRDAAAARLGAARQALSRAEKGYRPEEVDGARARLKAAEARVALLDQQIADASIRSPLDAIVSEKLMEAGEWASTGSALAVLTDLGHPWLTVYVEGPDVPRVRLGDPVEVATDDGRKRSGKVTYVASNAEFTPKNVQTREERAKLVYKVKVTLDNADGLFKPGMPAEARFSAAGSAR